MSHPRRKERGAAVVEFAILSGLLLIFLFGIIEFGFLWTESGYIANAAREGARVAAKTPDDPAGNRLAVADTAVDNYLGSLFLFEDKIDNAGFVTTTYTMETMTVASGGSNLDVPMARITVTVDTSSVWEPVLWPLIEAIFSGLPFFSAVDYPDDYLTSITQSATFPIEN
jgi:Flp pilus assembly protein TadG